MVLWNKPEKEIFGFLSAVEIFQEEKETNQDRALNRAEIPFPLSDILGYFNWQEGYFCYLGVISVLSA